MKRIMEPALSLARHLDALSVYCASAYRIVPGSGDAEDLLDQGGGLSGAFESVGRAPLLQVLRDPSVAGVMMADGDLEVEVKREGDRLKLSVRWAGQAVVEEDLPVPRAEPLGGGPWFRPDHQTEVLDLAKAWLATSRPLYAVEGGDGPLVWYHGGTHGRGAGQEKLAGCVPSLTAEELGSKDFRDAHGVRYAYVAGAMAGGIASVELVQAMAREHLLAFYGEGGVPLEHVESSVKTLSEEFGSQGSWGANLLHNPAEPAMEERTVDLYLKYGVPRVSASAYMQLSPAVARYRLHGIHQDAQGRVVVPNKVFAKVSRREVAERFLCPAPPDVLETLVKEGALTEEQAGWAAGVPVASEVTAEADSGGHTDHRPMVVLLPEMQSLRDQICATRNYPAEHRPRVGVGGGLGTPSAVWSAFAMGADYVLTGSVNQATREAGTSDLVKAMLADASTHDVATGPAPDMFEIGAKVQVLSRGSMYAQRAARLYDLYRTYGDLDALPAKERQRIEKQIFRRPLDEVWDETRLYWAERDPAQVERAERDPRHRLALTFRWYLGLTSRWARVGDEDRKRDFQIWCGPSMGAFNDWVAGSHLAEALMNGAAAHARLATARSLGLAVPQGSGTIPVE
jgi:PfaD family protein